ncbi:hypothetical protein [Rhizobium sp. G21]|uniref:hypothetical protein n=1 Tax=Rhizobium sp. G21 TaxID=2758439 RepID=UPI0015FFD318|nr:hypothetical protein [Rhizobium sp. G21]MBB1251388.1 hypothetical protein [Rhizobium sp. G21]
MEIDLSSPAAGLLADVISRINIRSLARPGAALTRHSAISPSSRRQRSEANPVAKIEHRLSAPFQRSLSNLAAVARKRLRHGLSQSEGGPMVMRINFSTARVMSAPPVAAYAAEAFLSSIHFMAERRLRSQLDHIHESAERKCAASLDCFIFRNSEL